jgi:methanethiol S-methyltransferase
MKKILYFLYSIICYLIFFATFLYMIGFVENISGFSFAKSIVSLFPKTADSGVAAMGTLPAIFTDLFLIALFGLQHSLMARPGFKKKWVQFIPIAVERSTYVLLASIALIILFYFWQPVDIILWNIRNSDIGHIFLGFSFMGWAILLISTFLINHFDLFGLRQVYLFARNEPEKIGYLRFRKPLFYKLIRHPIYFSFLVIFWFAPLMTLGHLVLAAGMTVYIFIGISHEEKDLVDTYGERYSEYKTEVPKIIPFTR